MDQHKANTLFEYRDGALYWKVNRGSNAKAGARAGRLLPTGYRSIQVSGRKYQEHRLVYLIHHGEVPNEIDHINGVKNDNRVENLRAANHSQNQANTAQRKSLSGLRGVRFIEESGRWAARIVFGGKEMRIGTFSTPDEASLAYKERAAQMFGEFVR